MQQNGVIMLSEELLIGTGAHRRVYINPEDPAQCIKINFGGFGDHLREMGYRKSRERRHLQSSLLTRYYGEVSTNMGTGYLFERIADYDGATSSTIEEIIKAEQKARDEKKSVKEIMGTEKEVPSAVEAVLAFRRELFRENIIIPDMAAYNYMVQFVSPDSWRIRIVDDIGSPTLIPVVYYIDFLGRSHVRRRWLRFIQWIQRKFPGFLSEEERRDLVTF